MASDSDDFTRLHYGLLRKSFINPKWANDPYRNLLASNFPAPPDLSGVLRGCGGAPSTTPCVIDRRPRRRQTTISSCLPIVLRFLGVTRRHAGTATRRRRRNEYRAPSQWPPEMSPKFEVAESPNTPRCGVVTADFLLVILGSTELCEPKGFAGLATEPTRDSGPHPNGDAGPLAAICLTEDYFFFAFAAAPFSEVAPSFDRSPPAFSRCARTNHWNFSSSAA